MRHLTLAAILILGMSHVPAVMAVGPAIVPPAPSLADRDPQGRFFGSPLPPPTSGAARPDVPVRRVQASASDMTTPTATGAVPPIPASGLPTAATPIESGQSLSLQSALYGALTGNPDLVSMRQGNVAGNAASPEAVEVARLFPTTLNPTIWIDARPWVLQRVPGGIGPDGDYRGPSLDRKDGFMYFSLRQPIELGHQTRHRHAIARAALDQQRWTVFQAELLTLVQTYRFFQTAAYRREKYRIARDLAAFNDRLVATLRRRLEANQVKPDEVTLAEIENEATRQQVALARQDYAVALTDLQNQIGTPEAAGTAEPLGEFILPAFIDGVEDQTLIQMALRSRPEIQAARAQIDGARAAIGLAKGDRIPTPVVGPVYQRNENGTQFFGFVYIAPIPILNNGQPLVRQREAEYRRACVALEQVRKRTVAQVTAATAKWNQSNTLVASTNGLADRLESQVRSMERLFDVGETDLTRLLQARQRLIQLENSRLDAVWQATQAQADLLTSIGAQTLIEALQQSAVTRASTATPPPSPSVPSPFR